MISAILNAAWWFVPLLIVIGLSKSPLVKGYVGELLVRVMAWMILDRKIYHRVHNVTLPTSDGTTQIDHVFVSKFGVFVLETKNMQGWIFGGEHQAQWTQKIFKKTYKFQNPLRQNFKHVKAIEAVLQIPPETIHSVVAFVGDTTFKTDMPKNVTYGVGAISYIKSYSKIEFKESQVAEMVSKIQSGRLTPTLSIHRAHIQHLHSRSNPHAERLCPKCGSILVLRTVRSGAKVGQQFWGCSTFPRCRVMQALN